MTDREGLSPLDAYSSRKVCRVKIPLFFSKLNSQFVIGRDMSPAGSPGWRRALRPIILRLSRARNEERPHATRADRFDGTLADLRACAGTHSRLDARRGGPRRGGGDDRGVR